MSILDGWGHTKVNFTFDFNASSIWNSTSTEN